MALSAPSERCAAIFWDIESTIHGSSTRRRPAEELLRDIGSATIAYLRQRGYAVSPGHQVVVTASQEREVECLSSLGFSVRRIDRRQCTVEDDLIRTVSEAAERPSPLLPPLVVLVSGNKTLTPLVELLRNRGHTVWVVSWRKNAGASLKRTADRFFPIENLLRALERKRATP